MFFFVTNLVTQNYTSGSFDLFSVFVTKRFCFEWNTMRSFVPTFEECG